MDAKLQLKATAAAGALELKAVTEQCNNLSAQLNEMTTQRHELSMQLTQMTAMTERDAVMRAAPMEVGREHEEQVVLKPDGWAEADSSQVYRADGGVLLAEALNTLYGECLQQLVTAQHQLDDCEQRLAAAARVRRELKVADIQLDLVPAAEAWDRVKAKAGHFGGRLVEFALALTMALPREEQPAVEHAELTLAVLNQIKQNTLSEEHHARTDGAEGESEAKCEASQSSLQSDPVLPKSPNSGETEIGHRRECDGFTSGRMTARRKRKSWAELVPNHLQEAILNTKAAAGEATT